MRGLRSVALLLVIGALAFVALVVTRTPVEAHAVLERSIPAQDQQLETAPELVETWYSEPIERSLTTLEVLDTQGNAVDLGETVFSDEDQYYAAVGLPAGLGPGIYTLSYVNVSKVDGHQWTGSFSFIVLNPDGSVPEGSAFEVSGGGQGYLPGAGDGVLRWLALIAAITLGGASMFYLFVARPAAGFLPPEKSRRVEEAAMSVTGDLVLLAVPVLVFAGAAQLGLLADRLGGASALSDILLHTRTGAFWIGRQIATLVLLLAFVPALFNERWRSGPRAAAAASGALLASLGVLITYSMGSHASAGGGEFWAVGSDFVHFVATAAWLGSLLQLPLVFWWTGGRLDRTERLLYVANVFDRFSWLAVVGVALLLGTGAFNGFVQLATLESLWETTYGRVLIAKLSLILPLLGVAGINAVFLKPALVDAVDALYGGDAEERPPADQHDRVEARLGRLQRALPLTVAAEFLAGAVVLVSVSILIQTTPSVSELRLAAGKGSGDFVESAQAGDLNTELTISPFVVGVNTFALTLQPQPGEALGEVLNVELRAFFDDPNASPSAGQQFSSQDLTATGEPGVFSADSSLLTQPGDWRLQARIRRRGFDDAEATFPVPQVGGILARSENPGMFDLPFDFVDWNIVAGGALIVLGLGVTLVWYNRPPSWQRATANAVVFGGGATMVAGAVLLFGVDAHEIAVPSTSPIAPTGESVSIGRQLYEMNCRVCHGADGTGGANGAADLTQHVPFHSDGTLFTWITEGLPLDSTEKRMPAWSSKLTDDERWHLVNFLRTTWGSGDFTPVLPDDTPGPGPTPTVPSQQVLQ